ncbi:HupE/UreJ family protein [Myceligenerans crystallogenes]|uniref:HupE/UreJ family protein n=1 Tax=Myceligenerans crystallogenes TaxID=316335 RepID=UPI0031D5BF4F
MRSQTTWSRVSRVALIVPAVLALAGLLPSGPAAAHGFSSTVYAEASQVPAHPDVVRTRLDLEYDLLVVSTAEHADAPGFFEDGLLLDGAPPEDDVALAALTRHEDAVLRYVTERFTVTTPAGPCVPSLAGEPRMTVRESVPYARVVVDHACPPPGDAEPGHTLRSELFGAAEGYVPEGTTTLVEGELDGRAVSAALDAGTAEFSTGRSPLAEAWEFFVLGAEHLLLGPDHLLFLLALITGERRLRTLVLTATAFTAAHSVTFLLAAVGAVSAPAALVEPVIAASIAVLSGRQVWRFAARRRRVVPAPEPEPRARAPRAGWWRIALVFAFGLVHGLGFAGALGIDEPFSWPLLGSLLVFNLGIEVVQVVVIVVVFPLLALLARRSPVARGWTTAVAMALVTAVALVWFVQRTLPA